MVSSRMMRAKIRPNQSGWPREAAIRSSGKLAAVLRPIRKKPLSFRTGSSWPTLTTTPPRATSRVGKMLISWLIT